MGTGLVGPFPESLCACTELTYLALFYEPGVSGQLSPQIGQLTNMQRLVTRKNTGMRGPLSAELSKLSKLKTMRAHNGKDGKELYLDDTWTVTVLAAKDGKDSTHTSFAEAFANYNPA